jgi:hypothetical protein
VTGSVALAAALIAPGAARATGGGQWALAEGGTTCFNLLVDAPVSGPHIIGTRQALQEIMAERDVAYVSAEAGGLGIGDVMQVVRNTGTVDHPATGASAGNILEVLGMVEVVDVNANSALLRVTGSCREVEVGDVLRTLPDNAELPADMPRMPVFDPDRLVTPADADAFLVMGALESVLAGEGDNRRMGLTQVQMYAQRDLVVLDQGADATWQSGDLAEVYRDRVYDSDLFRDSLVEPPLLGRGVVVRADTTSAVVQIVDSVAEIQVGDRARKAGTIWDYVNHPPTITCLSERATVRYGESVRLSAQASDEDGDTTMIGWRAGDGTLSASEGGTVTWTADGLDQATRDRGAIEIIATADDGRDEGTVSCIVPLSLAPPPAGGAAVGAAPGSEALDFVCPEFPLGVTAVDNRCKAVLDDVALRMRQDPRATAEIVGHTDATGSDETNLATSQARADAARTYLVETHGIEAARLTSAGVGSAQPMADNDTPEGQLRNRRVTIRVTLGGGPGQ